MIKENSAPIKGKHKMKTGSLTIGDAVIYLGTRCYRTPYEITGPVCSGGEAIIDRIHPDKKCRHPYHIIPAKDSKCTAYGWVSADSVKEKKVK